MTARRCVVLFARTPALEARAKGMGRAGRLFTLLRRRVLAAAAALPGVDLVVVGDAPASGVTHRLRQRGCTFGERLRHALSDVRALGYDHMVAVPLDCPRLGAAELLAAFAHLGEGRPVLGPSSDGGLYLLGLPGDPPAWLRGVDWCTPRVFRQLLARVPDVACLALLDDLDGPADLAALARDHTLPPELLTEIAALLARGPRQLVLPPRAAGRDVASPYASRPPPAAA